MVQDVPAWTYEHSVDCEVTVEFAWDFWTNIKNWALDADVESVEIDGPFATGARGFTNSKSSGRIEWRLVEVRVGRAVIEFPLPGAVGRCVWTFADTAGCTRITQRWMLQGEQGCLCEGGCCRVGGWYPRRHDEALQDDRGCGSLRQ